MIARGTVASLTLWCLVCFAWAADTAIPDFAPFEALVDALAAQPEEEQNAAVFDGETSLDVQPDGRLDFDRGTVELFFAAGWSGDIGYAPALVALRSEEITRYSVHLTSEADGVVWWNGETAEMLPYEFVPAGFYHLALVTEGAQTLVYVNSEFIGTFDLGYGAGRGLPLHIGTSDGVNEGFVGAIASVRIWNAALPEDAIYALSTFAGPPNPEDELAASLIAISDFSVDGVEVLIKQE